MDIEQWFTIRRGYCAPVDEITKVPLNPERWSPEEKKKAQTDSKALNTIQCVLTKKELNRVNPHENAKDLWDKLIELHKETPNLKDGETANQLHARIKGILNRLLLIEH
ncbi:uncharacterized protein LOC121994939 [Zingiber officinale]|uniref:uncharacterized protein LOC121994939 n=1 Tax=Zingiber officinale TaxID=94328 RepID=UPI001C4D9435|nr:uncharacterized protein LOC121994939 [Zingiber officinale]